MFTKSETNAYICAIEVAFDGSPVPSQLTDWQQFYNTDTSGLDFTKTYIGLGNVSFNEESTEQTAGTAYKQQLIIQFPNADQHRAERIQQLTKAKFFKVILTNGKTLLIGRNDYYQNTAPTFKVKLNQQIAEITIETQSINPTGYTQTSITTGIIID